MSSWTPDRDARLAALQRKGLTGAEIAEQLGGGLSRSAVIARLHRLRTAGASNVGPARNNPVARFVDRRRTEMAKFADAWADGAPTLRAAAATAGLTDSRAFTLWAAIKAELGPQAC